MNAAALGFRRGGMYAPVIMLLAVCATREVQAAKLGVGCGSPETGAFKGFGLAIMVDILAGALSGFGTSAEIDASRTAAHCFVAVRIDAFQPLPQYMAAMKGMIESVKGTPTLPDVDEIRIPGELEHSLAERQRAAGVVPLHPTILEGYRAAAEELRVPFDLTDDV